MRKKSALTNEKKLAIAKEACAADSSQLKVAKKYRVQQGMVSRWVKAFSKLNWSIPKGHEKKKYLPGAGRKPVFGEEIHTEIARFVADERQQGQPVSIRRILIQLKESGHLVGPTAEETKIKMRITRILNKIELSNNGDRQQLPNEECREH